MYNVQNSKQANSKICKPGYMYASRRKLKTYTFFHFALKSIVEHCTCWLPLSMMNMNIHWWKQILHHHRSLLASELICLVDCIMMPVSPVNKALKYCQGKWMVDILTQNNSPIFSIQVWWLNSVEFCICPPDSVYGVIYGQSIGPEDVCADQNLPCVSITIHSTLLNLGCFTPVSPKHVAAKQNLKNKCSVRKCMCFVNLIKHGNRHLLLKKTQPYIFS